MSDTSTALPLETPSSGLWNRLLATDRSTILLMLRLTLAVVFFPHGAQKVLGWFGGYGFGASMEFFTAEGMPALIAFLVIMGEFLGSIGLFVGLLSRVAAGGLAIIMLGAIFVGGHIEHGFFMNWFGNQAGEGFEYHLLAIGISLAIVIGGSGRFSMDRWLARDSNNPKSTRSS